VAGVKRAKKDAIVMTVVHAEGEQAVSTAPNCAAGWVDGIVVLELASSTRPAVGFVVEKLDEE
jgi:hypothetical protein